MSGLTDSSQGAPAAVASSAEAQRIAAADFSCVTAIHLPRPLTPAGRGARTGPGRARDRAKPALGAQQSLRFKSGMDLSAPRGLARDPRFARSAGRAAPGGLGRKLWALSRRRGEGLGTHRAASCPRSRQSRMAAAVRSSEAALSSRLMPSACGVWRSWFRVRSVRGVQISVAARRCRRFRGHLFGALDLPHLLQRGEAGVFCSFGWRKAPRGGICEPR